MKFLKKIYNLPVTIFYGFMGVVMFTAVPRKDGITFSQWIAMMIMLYLFFVIPTEIVIFLINKIINFFEIKPLPRLKKIVEYKNPSLPKEEPMPSEKDIIAAGEPNHFEKELIKQNIKKNQDDRDMVLSSMVYSGASEQLKRVNELMEILTSTKDQKELFLSLNELSQILYSLSQVEDLFDFAVPPSKMLKDLQANRSFYIDLFERRVGSFVDQMEGHDFEEFCADLLRKDGYEDVEVTPGSGDQGIDIIAYKHKVKYGIQCKRYASDIGNKAVQEAYAGAKYYDCHVPVVLTNQHFTESAIDLAGKTNVLLWDRDELNRLMEKIKV